MRCDRTDRTAGPPCSTPDVPPAVTAPPRSPSSRPPAHRPRFDEGARLLACTTHGPDRKDVGARLPSGGVDLSGSLGRIAAIADRATAPADDARRHRVVVDAPRAARAGRPSSPQRVPRRLRRRGGRGGGRSLGVRIRGACGGRRPPVAAREVLRSRRGEQRRPAARPLRDHPRALRGGPAGGRRGGGDGRSPCRLLRRPGRGLGRHAGQPGGERGPRAARHRARQPPRGAGPRARGADGRRSERRVSRAREPGVDRLDVPAWARVARPHGSRAELRGRAGRVPHAARRDPPAPRKDDPPDGRSRRSRVRGTSAPPRASRRKRPSRRRGARSPRRDRRLRRRRSRRECPLA
ncbi:hypothetical protein BH11MYX4_BH11MYX4_63360 [soil metagenome]